MNLHDQNTRVSQQLARPLSALSGAGLAVTALSGAAPDVRMIHSLDIPGAAGLDPDHTPADWDELRAITPKLVR